MHKHKHSISSGHDSPTILSLSDAQATDMSLTGPKAARLALMRQHGFPVPDGFILTIHALATERQSETKDAAIAAYQDLALTTLSSNSYDAPFLVAVRSSAIAEDLEEASFAGMQETVLNVASDLQMVEAIEKVHASADSLAVREYRERIGPVSEPADASPPELGAEGLAVLVQRQVTAQVAGVVFARDPLTGEQILVIEAVSGLGESLVSGERNPQRWRLDGKRHDILSAPSEPLLTGTQLQKIVTLVEQANELFGAPQDVEWAFDGQQLWMLQSRPITSPIHNWFSEHLPNDHYLWTAAFLNERLTQPVSPLGWSLVATHLERLALQGPLDLLGDQALEGPLLKLWRGHPYSRVEAWQRIYKLFPEVFLPEDAVRYFPEGDTSLRHAPRTPTWGLHLLKNGWRVLRDHFKATSPLHNPQAWKAFEKQQVAALIRFRFLENQLTHETNPIPAARTLLQEIDTLTRDLLELHRWSLLYADISYSLVRRLFKMRYGPTEGAKRAIALSANLESHTTRMNQELAILAHQVAKDDEIYAFSDRLANSKTHALPQQADSPKTNAFLVNLRHFLARYGHRFFSLDVYDAPWEANIPDFMRLLLTLAQNAVAQTSPHARPHPPTSSPSGRGGEEERSFLLHNNSSARFSSPLSAPALTVATRERGVGGERDRASKSPLLRLTRAYLRLREAQRFHWQQLLALQRRVIIHMGKWWVAQGQLAKVEDVFGLTWQELMHESPDRTIAATRMRQLHRLRKEAAQAPSWHYPNFLRGNQPLHPKLDGKQFQGHPVSPGLAQGPARLIAHPRDFERLHAGDILVTTSPDPGWTPIFGIVAGMVTERGGQLSHGAVVAREYGLPTVSGITGLFTYLQEGEPLLVDGTQGLVMRLTQK